MSRDTYNAAFPIIDEMVRELARGYVDRIEDSYGDLQDSTHNAIVESMVMEIKSLSNNGIREKLADEGFIPDYDEWLEEQEFDPTDEEDDEEEE